MSGPDRHAPVTRLEIAAAIPRGSRRARSQSHALAAAIAAPELADVREDFADNCREFIRICVRYASWEDRTTRPTRARVCAQAKFSPSTFKACRRFWERLGYLGTVRQGWTPALRASSLVDDQDANAAAVYVLCIPAQKSALRPRPTPPSRITRPLPLSRRDVVNPVRAREARSSPDEPVKGRLGRRSAATLARSCRAQVAAVRAWTGLKLTERHAAAILRPWLAAGWSPADLSHALAYERGGRRHSGRVDTIRDAQGWLEWRLSSWLGPGRIPYPSPSAERDAYAAAKRAAQDRRRTDDAAAAAAAVPAPPWVGELAAELRRRAAQSWRRR